MENNNRFTREKLNSMKYSYPWNGCISIDDTYDKHRGTYELHPTGYADLNGRKYVALPSGITITQEIKRKYNLI